MSVYLTSPEEIRRNILNLHQVVFEVTDDCHLKCNYCLYSDLYDVSSARSKSYMKFTTAKVVLDYLFDIWRDHNGITPTRPVFISFYGGEPLMNMELIKEIVSYVEKNMPNRKYIFSMTTNGVIIDKYIDYLVSKDFSLLVSLDGDQEASVHRIFLSGKPSFDIVYKNLKEIQISYPDYFRKKINFNAVVTSATKVSKILEFFDAEFGKCPKLSQLNGSWVRQDKLEIFKRYFHNVRQDIIESRNASELNNRLFLKSPVISQLVTYISHFSNNFYHTYLDLFAEDKGSVTPTSGTCIPFGKKMFITVKGKILQCEKISHKYTLGTIDDEGLNLNYDEIADFYNHLVLVYARSCEECAIKGLCGQCLLQLKSCEDKTYDCERKMSEEMLNKYKKDSLEILKSYPEMYERIMKDVSIN